MLTKKNIASLEKFSIDLYRLGLILTAIAMPLEIIPNQFLSVLSWTITVLLLQRVMLVLITKKFDFSVKNKLDILVIVAFVLPLFAASFSMLASVNTKVSLLELRSLFMLILRCLIIVLFSTKQDIRIFVKSIYVTAAAVIAFAFYQYIGDLAGLSAKFTLLIKNYSSRGDYLFPRIHSIAHEPLYYANYLLIVAGIAAGELYAFGKKSSNWIKLLFILALTMIILTVARGAIYGMVLGLLVLLLFARDKKFTKQILLYFVCSILISLVMLLGASLFKNQLVLDDFGSHAATTTDGSVLNRTATWKYSTKAFLASPLIGVGGSNSQFYIGENSPVENSLQSKSLSKIIVFNNTYLTFVAEYGLLGILAFIPMIVLLFQIGKFVFINKPKSLIVGAYAFLFAVLLQALTFETFLIMRVWVFVALIVALYKIINYRKTDFI